MATSKRHLLTAAAQAEATVDPKWVDSFAEYLQTECHLAENTVIAYRRDLRRFYEWLGRRSILRLTITDLAEYASWLHDQQLAPAFQ